MGASHLSFADPAAALVLGFPGIAVVSQVKVCQEAFAHSMYQEVCSHPTLSEHHLSLLTRASNQKRDIHHRGHMVVFLAHQDLS